MTAADMSGEPVIHSHHTDVLPEDHPLAHTFVFCQRCAVMLHARNNECMQTWVEWGEFHLCGSCAAPALAETVLTPRDFVNLCGEQVIF